LTFSFAPVARAGRRKKPIRHRGIVMSHERIEARSEESECGFQYHVCGRSFSWRSAVWFVPEALNAVGEGDGDDKVKAVTGVLVWVGSARAMGTSIKQRATKVIRMATLMAAIA
jgi:hypothetical protein